MYEEYEKQYALMFGYKIKSAQKEFRDCYYDLDKFMKEGSQHKICALYGLRRTGKTTLMHQYIEHMPLKEKEETVYILCKCESESYDLERLLKELHKNGIRNVFIDEITLLEDFPLDAHLLSDYFALLEGMKIVIAGTDSLGIKLASRRELYDRVEMIHTSYIPFSEFKRLLPGNTIEDYIMYGGTLTTSSYKENQAVEEYLNTAIVENITHSLEKIENRKSLHMELTELYSNDEFISAVNKIINTFSTQIALNIIERNYKNAPMSATLRNLRRVNSYEKMLDTEFVRNRTKTALKIKNKGEMITKFSEKHLDELKGYLKDLDLFVTLPNGMEFITQWGMIYAHATVLLDELAEDDAWCANVLMEDKALFAERADGFVKGEILENIVIYETHLALKGDKNISVTKYNAYINGSPCEADMVVTDKKTGNTFLFEVKLSCEQHEEQRKHLENQDFITKVEEEFGPVIGKFVLYQGENYRMGDVKYLNVEDFLCMVAEQKSLPFDEMFQFDAIRYSR